MQVPEAIVMSPGRAVGIYQNPISRSFDKNSAVLIMGTMLFNVLFDPSELACRWWT